jgi:hypothetical protein
MAHEHSVYDTDLFFEIDGESKEITYPESTVPVLVQGDHDSERFTFEMPRFIDGHDMMQCDVAQVHYVNMNSVNNAERVSDIYKITDLQIDEEDESKVLCSWLISGNATKYVGPLNFALRFACTVQSKVQYAWYTRPYTKIVVSSTIDNSEAIVEYYSDILQQWYDELILAGDAGTNVVVDAKNNALAEIAAAAESAAKEAVERIEAVETIRQIEAETLAAFEKAKQDSIAAVKRAEADAITAEKNELVAEIVSRVLFNGAVTYPNAEEVGF